MSTLRTSIFLDLAGNLASRARQYSQSLGRLASRGTRSMAMLRAGAAAAGRGLDALGNRYTALATGAAGVGSAKMVMDLQNRYTRLGIQAGVSEAKINALKSSIYDVAQAPDIRVDPGQITSAIEAIVEKTGDLDFAEKNIRNIGVAIQGTGASGLAVGELLAEFQKMDIKDPRQVLAALDTLNRQGKMGAFTLQNLAALGPRVITAYTATGRGGADALREMGAALQMIRMGTGSSEMAATAFEAVVRTLTDPAKLKLLGKAGIQVFDPEKLKQGQRVLRPINALMAEIIQATKGDKVKLGKIFDAEAVRAFNQAAGEYQRTGNLKSLDTFMAVKGDGAVTLADSARAAKTASAAMGNLYTAWKKVADDHLTKPIQVAADALNALGPETTGKIIKGIAGIGVALGGLVLARKAYVGFKGIAEMFGRGRKGVRGGKAGAGVAGGLGADLPLPVPVTVVGSKVQFPGGQRRGRTEATGNGKTRTVRRGTAGRLSRRLAGRQGDLTGMSDGVRPASNMVAGTRKASGSWLARGGRFLQRIGVGRWGKVAGAAGAVVTALASSADAIDAWSDKRVSSREAWGRTAHAGLSMGGSALGATIGSFILPGIGTMLGGMAGGWLGGLAGDLAEKFIGAKSTETATTEEPKQAASAAEARVKLEVTSEGQIKVKSVQSRDMDMNVDLGLNTVGVAS